MHIINQISGTWLDTLNTFCGEKGVQLQKANLSGYVGYIMQRNGHVVYTKCRNTN